MNDQCVAASRRYNEAFHNLHGRLPEVRINNGWIKINDMNKSLRPYEVLEMANNLDRRAREERPTQNRIVAELAEEAEMSREQREHREVIMRIRNSIQRRQEEENSVWDVRDELNARVQAQITNEVKNVVDNAPSNINVSGWRKHIRKDTMILFFNRLFENAGTSAFTMQRMMDRFISTGSFGDDEPDCDDCDIQREVEYLNEKMNEKDNSYRRLHGKLEDSKKNIKKLENIIKRKNKEMKELKKNSVVFSMDEVNF